VLWYQFNTRSQTIQVWDSFQAGIILLNSILTPLSICFPEHFHEKKDSINWAAFGLFINFVWAVDFLINVNRVDFILKIITLRETFADYLRGWLIPDAIALIGSTTCILLG